MGLGRLMTGTTLLALASLSVTGAAQAVDGEISFCNEFPHKVYVAIAYLQTDVNNYLTRGWLDIDTGKCYVFDTAIKVSTFYYHAESDPYKDGKHKVKMNWGKGKQFAVRDANFRSYNAEKKYSGMYLADFSQGPVSTGAPLTAIVTFKEDASVETVVPAPGKGGSDSEPIKPPSIDEGSPN
jgi:uncharacterized membrane protein